MRIQLPSGGIANVSKNVKPETLRALDEMCAVLSTTKPCCPKNHRFRPISFDEKTGDAIYACKCGIKWPRKAKFVCMEAT